MAFQPPRQLQAVKPGRALIPSALMAALTLGAAPASAMTEYLGGGFIEIRSGCEDFGWAGTHQVLIRMEPQGLDGNATDETQMSLLMNTGTIALRFNLDRGIRYSYTPTQAVYVWNGPNIPAEPTMSFAFGIDADWPLRGEYMIERLQVSINNFNEHEGCSAWLYGSLVRN